jgi:hypothetical protein
MTLRMADMQISLEGPFSSVNSSLLTSPLDCNWYFRLANWTEALCLMFTHHYKTKAKKFAEHRVAW